MFVKPNVLVDYFKYLSTSSFSQSDCKTYDLVWLNLQRYTSADPNYIRDIKAQFLVLDILNKQPVIGQM